MMYMFMYMYTVKEFDYLPRTLLFPFNQNLIILSQDQCF